MIHNLFQPAKKSFVLLPQNIYKHTSFDKDPDC